MKSYGVRLTAVNPPRWLSGTHTKYAGYFLPISIALTYTIDNKTTQNTGNLMHTLFSRRTATSAAIIISSLLTGCASIVNGSNQVVSVEARNKGEMVSGASCKLENNKGVFYVTTPGTVTLHRAYDDLSVKCEKENITPGLATVKSSTKGMAFGNILFGGFIGAAVDAGSGAAYDYPSLITVLMGENTKLPASPASAQATTPAATQPQAPAAVAYQAPTPDAK